tara:strand:- start:2200 stop:2610 length:411 start_codon:yes stop_codon:yes gene_type:complete
MSSSRRLAKLKRSSVVNDIGSSSRNQPRNNVMVGNVTQEQRGQKRQTVDPMTILTWHEQRLDTMEDKLKEVDTTINPQLIVSLVETIEEMEKKLTLLNEAYNTLVNERTKKEVKDEVLKNLKEEGNTVKLNISEKN